MQRFPVSSMEGSRVLIMRQRAIMAMPLPQPELEGLLDQFLDKHPELVLFVPLGSGGTSPTRALAAFLGTGVYV